MKNKVLILATLLLTANCTLFAKTNWSQTPYYAEITQGYIFTEKSEKSIGEPLVNIVGGDTTRTELEIGKKVYYKDRYYMPFLYGYINGKEQNNEWGGGLGLRVQSKPYTYRYFPKFRAEMIAKAGIGTQNVSGKTFTASTNATVLNYVFGGQQSGSFKATYMKDTTIIEMGLGGNLVFNVSHNLDLKVGYTFVYKYVDYGYLIDGEPVGTYIAGASQSNHIFTTGLSYRF